MFLFFAFNAKAVNDTLIRAQVYNFNVGDSFEYRHYYMPFGTYSITDWYWKVVENVSHSTNGDTLFIDYNNSGLVLSNLQQYEWYIDRDSSLGSFTCTIDTQSNYYGRITNDAMPDNIFEGFTHKVYGEGIGKILNDFQAWGDYQVRETTTLIYYRKGTEVWGTQVLPGTQFNNVIEVTSKTTFHLFPNPTSDELTITTEAEGRYSVSIYDVMGNCVSAPKNFSTNLFHIKVNHLPSGYYYLKLMDEHSYSITKSFVIAR